MNQVAAMENSQTTVLSDRIPWGPIGEQVYKRTYSRVLNADEVWEGRLTGKAVKPVHEIWPETVERVVTGNLGLVDEKFIEGDEKEKLAALLLHFGALPAGRHLNASGVKGRQFLFNCFEGDTKVLTRRGFKAIKELQGEVEVLSQGTKEQTGVGCWTYGTGEWRKATFRSFGKQRLFEILLSDGTKIEATADHKWYVTKRSEPVETINLKGHMVPIVTAPKPERDAAWSKGLLHGFVFGDGSVSRSEGKTYSAHVLMFGEKDKAMVPFFEKAGYKVSYPDYCDAYVGRLPSEWKELPPDDASPSYWRGFVSGFITADGTVDKRGCVFAYQADRQALEHIREKAIEVGFSCTNILLHREKSPFTGEDAHLYRFAIRRFSVDPVDLIAQKHRENFELAGDPTSGRSLQVIEVVDLNKEEEVFCCVEPETHTIVITNSILSGQCHASGWDAQAPADHFSFLFDELMQGGGVGSNYSNRYLAVLPPVTTAIDLHIICQQEHPDHSEIAHLLSDNPHSGIKLVVPDSREGWTEAIDLVFKTAFADSSNPCKHVRVENSAPVPVIIDVSIIRPKGALLRTSGGTACGPGPLVAALMDVTRHLNGCVGRQLNSLDAMTLDHHLASCVVAGGKRRSSRMSVKSWLDADIFEFINCKREDGSHWTTNISVEIDDQFLAAYKAGEAHASAVMKAIVLGKRSNGEPGIWNRSLSAKGEREPDAMFCPNPCGEIGLYMWENCNLGHINMQYFAGKPFGEMFEAFRLMARWLVRATFGDIPQRRQREVVDRNRRIGVGFFGFHGWLALNGIRYSDCHEDKMVHRVLAQAKATVQEAAESYAKEIGIPTPVKFTTLAPTGTTAILPGTTTSGQAMMGPWYKRLVRYFETDPELAMRKEEGYDVYPDQDAKNTEYVVYWCEDPLAARVRSVGLDPEEILEGQYDISFETCLKVQAMFQDLYADNAISYTINLPLDKVPEEEEMERQLASILPRLKGTTFFPEKSRKNTPIQPISKAEFDAHTGRKEVTMFEEECRGGCPIK